MTVKLQVSRRQRATPYTKIVQTLGVSGFSVVNHTILPKGFQKTVEEDYWHLKEHVQIWDVGCERQVELKGPDAAKLAQLMTPRNLTQAVAGQCFYAPVIDHKAGMLNDPIILKLAEDHFWFSIADSDMLLWAKGLAVGMQLDVEVDEPDVWPMAIQGPKSDDVMSVVFGDDVRAIKFFRFKVLPFHGHPLVVARSGFSKQGGFEIYLDRPELGEPLWKALWNAGQEFNIAPGCPHLVERIEGGLLSYGNEMTRENNPLESGLARYCALDGSVDFIGKDALLAAHSRGHDREIRGIIFDGEKCPPCQYPWKLEVNEQFAGRVTSAAWSPRYEQNVALAMVEKAFWDHGTRVQIHCEDGTLRCGMISDLPMR